MEFERREVRGPLAVAVRELWFLRGPAPARFERIFPMPDLHLVVNLAARPYRVLEAPDAAWRTLGPVFCSGLRAAFVVSEAPDPIVNAGAVLRPDAPPMLGLDPGVLANAVTDVDAVPMAIPAADAAPAAVLDTLESSLGMLLAGGRSLDAVVRAAIDRLDDDPAVPIGVLAAEAGLAHPSFDARFRRATGITPKHYARLVRFHRLIDRTPVGDPASWTDLAAEGGYADQSHVIRDFRRFTGVTPADYHRRVAAAGPDAVRFVPEPADAWS